MMLPLLQEPIPNLRLLWLLVPVILTLLVLRWLETEVWRRFPVAVARAGLQLGLIGFVLVPLLNLDPSPLVLGIMALQCFLAGLFSFAFLKRGPGPGLIPMAFAAICPVVLGLVLMTTALVIPDVHPLVPRYALMLTGMLAGVGMNAVAITGERFLSSLNTRRGQVEGSLAFGLPPFRALLPLMADAQRAAILPSLNSLIAVGLVSLPGMMTGQVLGGTDPVEAARYQFVIMCLWPSTAALSSGLFLWLLTRSIRATGRLPEPQTDSGQSPFLVEELEFPTSQTHKVYTQRPEGDQNPGFFDPTKNP